jgi:hypothetical protein
MRQCLPHGLPICYFDLLFCLTPVRIPAGDPAKNPRERRDIIAATSLSSCSQTRITSNPIRSSCAVTFESLCLFLLILALQNSERVFGTCPHFLQPCQKQPSTKTATFCFWKKKSGRPGSVACNTHPLFPALTKAILKTFSVVLLLRARIAPMVLDRTAETPPKAPFSRYFFKNFCIKKL